MICERCGDDVMAGRLVVRRTFAGFACHPCADEVKRIEWEEGTMAKKSRKTGKAVVGRATETSKVNASARKGSLAALIDPLLLSGGHTIKEIAAELATKGGDAAKGKDLAANVRARMVSYTRKGWKVVKNDERHVHLMQRKS